MEHILNLTRNLLQDTLKTGSDFFTYTTSPVFTMSEPNTQSVTEVYVNDAISGFTHSYNSTSNRTTLSGSLFSGDTIQIDYTYYANYSDTELKSFVQATLVHLSTSNYNTFRYDTATDTIYPTPSSKEEYLIALVTSILISPNNFSIRTPDITITRAHDMSVEDKIRKVISSSKKDVHGIFAVVNGEIII
jgi:hypothetical protein